MMAVASTSLVIPAALSGAQCKANSSCQDNVIFLSRGISVVLLVLFAVYLNFRLNSHVSHFEEDISESHAVQEETEHRWCAVAEIAVLLLCTLFATISARLIMRTTDSITESSFITERFIGFILLPLVVEGPDRLEAVRAAYHDKMDQALDFAIGRSMQTALFSTPFLVMLGWVMRISEPMTLHFQSFETVALFLSAHLVSTLIGDGKSNYLEGAICLAT
jgi:Ca2+:H+ antiporter